MAQNNNIEMFKKRLVAELTRDKKKAFILGLLLITAIFFVGKMLFKSSPATATAMPAGSGVTAPADTGTSDADIAMSDIHRGANPARETTGERGKEIKRDIFLPNPEVFPISKKKVDADGKPTVVQDAENKITAALKAREEEIRVEGASLNLKSTITGRVPIAIIDGAVLGLGGVIKGFRVIEIQSQACIVEKDGVKLNLTMK
jgi:hypothetical protein